MSQVPLEHQPFLNALPEATRHSAKTLFPSIYDELRRIAGALMADQNREHTLQATALVHEAWLKISPNKEFSPEDRRGCVALAAVAMRSVLVDHARARSAKKRGAANQRLPVELDQVIGASCSPEMILRLDEAMEKLIQADEELGRLAMIRCFAGLTTQEAADLLGESLRTVQRNWMAARAFLNRFVLDDD